MTGRLRLALFSGTLLALSSLSLVVEAKEPPDATLLERLIEGAAQLDELDFAQVVRAATGRKVLPVDPSDPVERRVLAAVGSALDAVVEEMNAPDSPAIRERRINETSRHFEEALARTLDARAEFDCGFALTAEGKGQRSGYPDLRLVDRSSGRIFYLDPKIHEASSRESSFRTFYFEPRTDTNKILEDATHLVLGIAHDEVGGRRHFAGWVIVDVSGLRVRLKAEFQSSNRELYRDEAVVGASQADVTFQK